MQQKHTVQLELLEIRREPRSGAIENVNLQTNHGTIACRYRRTEKPGPAVVWAAGSHGGMSGPADGVYDRLADQLLAGNIASLQLEYRQPGSLIDCVLDVLLGIGFLRNESHTRFTLVGHSFGGAVVINAGVASAAVAAVATLSTQLTGADDIAELNPRPVLLIHGSADDVRSEIGSQRLYEIAREPKELILYPGCGHQLDECRDQLDRDLGAWIRRVTPAG